MDCTVAKHHISRLQSRPINLLWRQQRQSRTGVVLVRAASTGRPQPGMRSFDPPSSSNNGSMPHSSVTSSVASSSTVVAAPAAETLPSSYRVTWWQAMRFNGAVPERVNGRLAMMAFLYIARREMETGQTVIQQAQQLPHNWSSWCFVALCLVFVYAAFPPALVGAKEEDFGFFSVAAEKTNGRAAMIALAVLTALEWHSGFCFF